MFKMSPQLQTGDQKKKKHWYTMRLTERAFSTISQFMWT